jgi:hypothetical protein
MKPLIIKGLIVTLAGMVGAAYLAVPNHPKGPTFEHRWSPVGPMLEEQLDSRRLPNPLYDLPKADRRIWDAHRRYATI